MSFSDDQYLQGNRAQKWIVQSLIVKQQKEPVLKEIFNIQRKRTNVLEEKNKTRAKDLTKTATMTVQELIFNKQWL